MRNIFNSIALPLVKTNRFDLSHDVKLSFQMGELVPTCAMECLPGDVFEISTENMLRFAPLISPVMHKVRVTTHYFFVPNRILWPEWDRWITGDFDIEAPYLRIGADEDFTEIEEGSVCDYLGYPVGSNFGGGPGSGQYLQISPLPMSAYMKIYDEYYRDQNIQNEVWEPLVAGNCSGTSVVSCLDGGLFTRAWQHDYFTSALPYAQKGDSVQLPLIDQGTVPVTPTIDGTFPIAVNPSTGNIISAAGEPVLQSGSGGFSLDGEQLAIDPAGSLEVDIQADAVDINTVRRAFKLQEWLERNARGGTRYVENILAHFGVKSSDARLQRPEYLGGSKQNMVISEVLATAQSTGDGVAVGTMAGHGISVGGGNSFRYKCEEHGWIIGIINVQPDTAYYQGLHRSFSRFDRLDYAWPTFANIGEQEVLNQEIYANVTNTQKSGTFGYVPRYAEYKFANSRVAGEMRSTLDFWHLARKFNNLPTLSSQFIYVRPEEVERIFAVTDPESDHIYAHVFNNIKAIRKLPKFGIPTI